jgi:hypothetical protein
MIKKGKWEHIRSGRMYDVLNTVKSKYGGEWVESVLYTDNQGELYTRPLKEFKQKFEKNAKTIS